MRRFIGIGCFIAALAVLSVPIIAQDKKGDKPMGKDDKGMGGVNMAKMMAECKKLAQPGEQHENLKSLAGDWEIAGKFRMDPNAKWMESKSTSHADWMLGGRFLTQKYKGEAMPEMGMDQPFEGFGILGYDNDKKKYISAWMDNCSTMIQNGEGTATDGGKTITFMSHFQCPIEHKPTWSRTVYKIQGSDRYVMQMYGPDMATEKEYLCMELTHTRKK